MQRIANNLTLLVLLLAGVVGLTIVLWPGDRIADPEHGSGYAQSRESIQEVADRLDRLFQRRWQAAGIEPALPADNLTVIRRLSQGLAGTIPSLEEIRRLEQVPADQQIDWWLARMLGDRRVHQHLAERFARALVGVEGGPFAVYRRRRLVDWLTAQLAANRAYDALVRELVSSRGLWTDTPATNFVSLAAHASTDQRIDPVSLTVRTSRALLGCRLDCLECHGDFLGNIQLGDVANPREGQQLDFHQLAAFYGQVAVTWAGIQDRPTARDYTYALLGEAESSPITPAVPYRPDLLPTDGPLRVRLAGWLTHPDNKPFARNVVNRLWAILFGEPIIQPIDDMPLMRELPEELETLADELIAGGFDLRRILRIMVATRVFRLDSRLAGEVTAAHEELLAVYPLVRLRPEQMARSLLQATTLTTIDDSAGIAVRLHGWGAERDFAQRYGDFGSDEFSRRSETVSQRLLLLNGQLLRERIANGLLAPRKLALLAPSPQAIAQASYLACYTRYPTAAEQDYFVRRLRQRGRQPKQQVVVDLYWAMLNSAEFGWSH